VNNPKKKKVAVQNSEDQSTMSIDTASGGLDVNGAAGQTNTTAGNAKKSQQAAPAAAGARAKQTGQPAPTAAANTGTAQTGKHRK
jgi:hypothetical protein